MELKKVIKLTRKLNILYVENEEKAYKKNLPIFELLFSKVVLAKSAEEALARYIIKKNFYDIVLTSSTLPCMNTNELIQRLLKKNENQKICLISNMQNLKPLKSLLSKTACIISKPTQKKDMIFSIYETAQKVVKEKYEKKYQEDMEKTNQLLEKKLELSTTVDLQTGLKNRASLVKDIKNHNFTMMALVDIDYLEFINNLYGSQIGSLVIKNFSNLLKEKTKNTDFFLYQIAGDQFAICSNDDSPEIFESFINKLSEKVTNLVIYIDEIKDEVTIDATIGVTYELNFLASCGIYYESHLLFVQAGSALKHAKQHKKALVSYDESLNTLQDIQNIIFWKDMIKEAIKNNHVVPVFQPIVDKDKNILKYETLMRIYDSEDNKLITPDNFLDISIKTKQYSKLSQSIISQAIKKLISTNHTISINLTYQDVENKNIWRILEKNLKNCDIGSRLIVEIVESEDIKDYDLLLSFFNMLKQYGVKIAIDNFGSGYSNFENIVKFDPDYIKIDSSLVQKINDDLGSYAIVKAITEFAHTLNKKVTAKFVHSKEVLDTLIKLQVDEFQGNHFYKAEEDFIEKKTQLSVA